MIDATYKITVTAFDGSFTKVFENVSFKEGTEFGLKITYKNAAGKTKKAFVPFDDYRINIHRTDLNLWLESALTAATSMTIYYTDGSPAETFNVVKYEFIGDNQKTVSFSIDSDGDGKIDTFEFRPMARVRYFEFDVD